MIPTTAFYHELIRKYTIAFGKLFNDIHVIRRDSSDVQQQDIKIPLTWANKRKFFYTHKQKLLHPSGITLPRMSFALTGFNYNPERQLNPQNQLKKQDATDPNLLQYLRVPTPYDLNFNLTIWYKNVEDGLQILEQIIPYFNPYYNITIKEVPSFLKPRDVKLRLDGINPEITDDLTEDTGSMRVGYWSLDFTMEGNFYPPIKDQAVIKKIETILHDMDHDDPIVKISTEVDPMDSEWDDGWDIKERKYIDWSDELQLFNDQTMIEAQYSQTSIIFQLPVGKSLLIDWGDGSSEVVDGNGTNDVVKPHNYSQELLYQIKITGDLSEITKISCFNLFIHLDISELSLMPNLEHVAFHGYNVYGNINVFSQLTNLTYVNLYQGPTHGNINVIENYTDMTGVYLSHGYTKGNTNFLSNFSLLSQLEVEDNPQLVGVLSTFNGLSNLFMLELSDTQHTGSLSDISSLTGLRWLRLANLGVDGTTAELAGLMAGNAIEIDVTNNPLITGPISALNAKTSLTFIYLGGTSATGDLTDITGITSLGKLEIQETPITGDVYDLVGIQNNITKLNFADSGVNAYSASMNWGNMYTTGFDYTNCGFSQADTDRAINDLYTKIGSWQSKGYLKLTGNSIPSATGQSEAAALVADGWTVEIDE